MTAPRIAFVTNGLDIGGAEHMLCKLVEQADPARLKLMVVSLRDEGTFGERIRTAGASLVCCQLHRPRGVRSLLAAYRALRRFEPTVLQGWMYHGNLAASLFARWLPGRPAVMWGVRQTLYSLQHEGRIIRLILRALAALAGRVRCVVYNSRMSLEQHRRTGIRSAADVLIPNGFDLARYRPDAVRGAEVRAQLGIAADAPVVGLVSRVHPMKDHANFIAAAALIAAALPDARFVLAGTGTDGPDIRAQLEQAGVAERTHCLGRIYDTERLYPALDAAVLSSAWGDAWPNVLGEAMACGVPCVATDIGDCREIVGDVGRIVPPRDPAALAAACIDLLGLEAAARQELGMRARRRAAAFGIDSVYSRYFDLWSGRPASAADREAA